MRMELRYVLQVAYANQTNSEEFSVDSCKLPYSEPCIIHAVCVKHAYHALYHAMSVLCPRIGVCSTHLTHIAIFQSCEMYVQYLSQETLRNPRRKSAVFPRHRRGYPRNRVRVSAESSKGVRGIVNGCPWNR